MALDAPTLAAFLAAVGLLGLSKGGFSGIGFLSMPILLLVMSPAAAAGLMLPVLMIQDAFSVWLYRGKWDRANLWVLLPAAVVGVGLGLILFAALPVKVMLGLLGAVTIAFAAKGLLRPSPAKRPSRIVGYALGAAAGLTSTVLHQGGPPFQMYLIPQKLPRETFVATTVLFFTIVNIIKLPGFLALGHITWDRLSVALAAAPFALFMTWLGLRLVRLVPQERFYLIIHLILAGVGAKLLFDAFA
ncbi:MAG: sulfite exporter TauE/SafE family protein [Pseudomonadota bacterium]